MRFASPALFAGAVSRRDLEIILAYLRLRLDRVVQDTNFSGAHCVAIEQEIAIIETALACLALPIPHAGHNDNDTAQRILEEEAALSGFYDGLLPEGR